MTLTTELLAKRRRLAAELENLPAGHPDPGVAERRRNVQRGLANIEAQIEDAERRGGRILRASGDPRATGEDVGVVTRTPAPTLAGHEGPDEARRLAHECVADHERDGRLSLAAADRLADVIDRDTLGVEGRYLRAVANPAYERAFARLVSRGPIAAIELSDEERDAVAVVRHAVEMRAMAGGSGFYAGMGVGSGPDGGYAVPFTLDPTIQIVSDGSINPLRQLARVRTIGSSEYRGISSEGVAAHFVPEGQEASDDSPTLDQPTIRPQRAQCFVPVTIELTQDWASLSTELARLFADARDQLEAEKFLAGTGETVSEPEGLLTGATETVATAGVGTVAPDDLYTVQDALPARWQPRAAWLGSLATKNTLRRLVGSADPDEPQLFSPDEQSLLGRPFAEASQMPAIATTARPLAYGDIQSAFLIVDRIGMSIEVISHLFGANRRPTGERGFFAYWRTSSQVVAPTALRVLEVS